LGSIHKSLAALLLCAASATIASACEDETGSLPPPSASAGTGGEAAGGAGGSGTPSACDDYGEAYCNKLDECVPTFVKIAYGDASRCAYRQSLVCAFHIGAAGSGMTEQIATACVDGFAGVTCGALLAGSATACPFVPGSVADGEMCVSSWQCTSTYCQLSGAEGCGVCAPRVPAGGGCAADPNACAPGTGCAMDTCVAFAAEGASCAGGEPCDIFTGCVNGACSFGSGPGTPCDGANPCDVWNQGTFCSAAGTCDPIAFASNGAACGDVMGVYTACSAGAKCNMSSVCVPLAEDGAACGGPSEIGCYEPHRCVGGTCRLPDAATCGMGAGGAGGGA
jgi:hypothetical protein